MKYLEHRAASRRAAKQSRDGAGRFALEDATRTGSGRLPPGFLMEDIQAANSSSKDARFVDGGPTGRMQVIAYGKKEYQVPVDKRGYVPTEYLVQHYFDVVQDGKVRKPVSDSRKDAGRIIEGRDLTPEQAVPWIAHPNRCDIRGIDTSGSPEHIYDRSYPRQKGGVTVSNAMPSQERMARAQLRENFTTAELAKVTEGGGLQVVMGRPNAKASGLYSSRDNTEYIDPKKMAVSPDVITHETVHSLRNRDPSRTGTVTESQLKTGGMRITDRERTLEEAATEGETVARIRPFRVSGASYYGDIPGKGKTAKQMMDEDRRLFTEGSHGRPVRGKAAVTAVEGNFSRSNISNLKLEGSPCTAKQYAGMIGGRSGKIKGSGRR